MSYNYPYYRPPPESQDNPWIPVGSGRQQLLQQIPVATVPSAVQTKEQYQRAQFEKRLAKEREKGFWITNWLQGPCIGPTFLDAESSFVCGSTHRGKSRLLIRLAERFRHKARAKIIDAFGAENDSESTAWLLNPETRDSTALIVGNEVQIEGFDKSHCIPVGQFTLEAIKPFDVVVTDRALFGPMDDKKYDLRYYAALARIFEFVKRRHSERQLICFLIREAWNVIYSQMKAGISRDEQSAQNEFRKLHNQRYHAKVACLLDTQRFTDLAASVRTLIDNLYIKGFGSQPIPSELDFLFKPWLFGKQSHRDWMMRNLPVDEFILLTEKNGVGYGTFNDIEWHPEKGYSPLEQMHIRAVLKPMETEGPKRKPDEPMNPYLAAQPQEMTSAQETWGPDAQYVPSKNDLHRRMRELKERGLTYKEIAAKLLEEGITISWRTVSNHMCNRCACEESARA